MTVVNVHYAKTNFSQYLDRALRGEEIIVARYGKPLIRLSPLAGSGAYNATDNSAGLVQEGAMLVDRYGVPIAELVALQQRPAKRQPGALAGKGYWITDDFDETPPEILEAIEKPLFEDMREDTV
jgi:prevent-host-death family protein